MGPLNPLQVKVALCDLTLAEAETLHYFARPTHPMTEVNTDSKGVMRGQDVFEQPCALCYILSQTAVSTPEQLDRERLTQMPIMDEMVGYKLPPSCSRGLSVASKIAAHTPHADRLRTVGVWTATTRLTTTKRNCRPLEDVGEKYRPCTDCWGLHTDRIQTVNTDHYRTWEKNTDRRNR